MAFLLGKRLTAITVGFPLILFWNDPAPKTELSAEEINRPAPHAQWERHVQGSPLVSSGIQANGKRTEPSWLAQGSSADLAPTSPFPWSAAWAVRSSRLCHSHGHARTKALKLILLKRGGAAPQS